MLTTILDRNLSTKIQQLVQKNNPLFKPNLILIKVQDRKQNKTKFLTLINPINILKNIYFLNPNLSLITLIVLDLFVCEVLIFKLDFVLLYKTVDVNEN